MGTKKGSDPRLGFGTISGDGGDENGGEVDDSGDVSGIIGESKLPKNLQRNRNKSVGKNSQSASNNNNIFGYNNPKQYLSKDNSIKSFQNPLDR